MTDAIAVFARAPQPGLVKTRLAKVIGNEAAAALYGAMLRDTLALALKAARKQGNCEVVLTYTPDNALDDGPYSLAPFWRGPCLAQGAGNLGERLLNCASRLHEQGSERVVIIGSDSPDLPPVHICRAFNNLTRKELIFDAGVPKVHPADLVFGPARDGGFYLVATAAKIQPKLFNDVEWSDKNTLSQVLANAERLGQSVTKIWKWDDVDAITDLRRLSQRLVRDPRQSPTHAPHTARWLRANRLLESS